MPAILTNPQMDALAAAWQHAGAGFAETRAPKILDKKLISARAKQAVREMREQSEKNGNCNMTIDEISAIIAETRREIREEQLESCI
ncbi:hypothetical protein FACS1894139_04520 [Planctomycetales bacterium]|nr:hypothetical protein FACS1894107_09200 [Planctomycetales bacterium]GHS99068.1 hypothetical protein FACS1894108_08380 [Planctomycetales bacterium]GHT03674.1 hypothetical protein FACS1894139_04520 [Planctomycetales bacterium]